MMGDRIQLDFNAPRSGDYRLNVYRNGEREHPILMTLSREDVLLDLHAEILLSRHDAARLRDFLDKVLKEGEE